MRNRYYVSNDTLPGPTYVGGSFLIKPWEIGTAILTPQQAKALKDDGYTIHLKDENIEYGTGPEDENNGGGGGNGDAGITEIQLVAGDNNINMDECASNVVIKSVGDGSDSNIWMQWTESNRPVEFFMSYQDGDDNVYFMTEGEGPYVFDPTGLCGIQNFRLLDEHTFTLNSNNHGNLLMIQQDYWPDYVPGVAYVNVVFSPQRDTMYPLRQSSWNVPLTIIDVSVNDPEGEGNNAYVLKLVSTQYTGMVPGARFAIRFNDLTGGAQNGSTVEIDFGGNGNALFVDDVGQEDPVIAQAYSKILFEYKWSNDNFLLIDKSSNIELTPMGG